MSKCMTIADETIDQKETCTEIPPKDIVDFILEEALLSAFVTSDKGCSRIGDFNVAEDFRQQYDQLPHQRDFEQVNHTQTESTDNPVSNHNFGQNVERSATRGNLGLIIDSYVDEKLKPSSEYTVINEDDLANNELQIQNGQIHLGKNTVDLPESQGKEGTTETREIKQFNAGNLKTSMHEIPTVYNNDGDGSEVQQEKNEVRDHPDKARYDDDPERPFEPLTTEELRQVWGNGNSSLVGKWDGDVLAQREEAVRLMEELSSVHVFSDNSADPNRPRACAFDEEDVKKMTKEIEEISFINCHASTEDSDAAYPPDGQGDADLESKASTKIKESITKSQNSQNPPEDCIPGSKSDHDGETQVAQVILSPSKVFSPVEKPSATVAMENGVIPAEVPEPSHDDERAHSSSSKLPTVISEEPDLQNDAKSNVSKWSPKVNTVRINSAELVDNNAAAPSEKLQNPDWCIPYSSFVLPEQNVAKNEMFLYDYITSEMFLSDSVSPKVLPKGPVDSFPDTTSLFEDIAESLDKVAKFDEYAIGNVEFESELDKPTHRGKRSSEAKEPRGLGWPEDATSGSKNFTQKGTSTLGRMTASSTETKKELNLDLEKRSQLLSMDTHLFLTKMEEIRESQDAGNLLQGSSLSCEKSSNDQEQLFISEEINEKLEKTLNLSEKNSENMQDISSWECDLLKVVEEEQLWAMDDDKKEPSENGTGGDSYKIENDEQEANESKPKQETPTASQRSSQGEVSDDSKNENGSIKSSEDPTTCIQTFRLHSQKMYWGPNHEVVGPVPNEFSLTESEEGLIDMTESVIQVIEPSESETDSTGKITFSLLSETPHNRKNISSSSESEIDFGKEDAEECDFSDTNAPKRVYSGMTTIGPIKNIDRDPKDLTAPEIDYGKMTRITSSRQLGKEMGIFSSEMTAIKIVEEDDSDDDVSVRTEDDRADHTSLVNRDITSLTKVQKIREVMSHQPKSDEDFEDKEVPRPRLDLKDVESLTDERYKVADVNIPILSFEISESNINAGKELMDSIGLVISGIANPGFYDDEIEEEEEHTECDKDQIASEQNQPKEEESWEGDAIAKEGEGNTSASNMEAESKGTTENVLEKNSEEPERTDSRQKFSTLGTAFKKASTKFIRKEAELLMRSSKSLPRDSSRISTTDSIRSIIDDCQSSATNMLKKSRSLLKNTQSIFKSISQSRVTSDASSKEYQKKTSPSESDVSAVERKFSGFLKKEDFVKAKNMIKDKVEKTIKSFEKNSDQKDLAVAIRNTDNLQVERAENFKKLLPKSPLVYKSQFVKSQMDVQSNMPELATAASNPEVAEEEKNVEEPLTTSASEEGSEKTLNEDRESQEEKEREEETALKEQFHWTSGTENQAEEVLTPDEYEPQPEYIVLETVQGLPSTDLESPSSEKENIENTGKKEIPREEKDSSGKASNSPPIFSDSNHDIAPCFPEIDEQQKTIKSTLEKKTKTKKKNLTARFRSFWCSAFGKVKTPRAKGDLS